MSHHQSKWVDRLRAGDPLKWVFAGDSITHGALHTNGWRDYTELLSERVRYELKRSRDCVIKTGVSGWRIGKIASDLEWSVLQYQPQVVSIAIGMNDATAGEAGVTAFENAYREVITRVAAATDPILILHTPPRILPLDPTRTTLQLYAEAVRRIAADTGAVLVDHHAAWEPLEQTGRIAYFLSNAIHPNEYGHRLMAATLLRTLNLWSPDSGVGRLFVP
jgi:acyl-CoA thioesterase-1